MHGPQETSTGTYQQANNDEESDLPQSSTPSSLPVWWMSTEEMETCGARKAGTLDRAHYQTSFSTAAGVCSKRVSYLPRLLGFRWICFWICETICCSRVLCRDWQQHCEVNFPMFSQTNVTHKVLPHKMTRFPVCQCGSLWVHAKIQPEWWHAKNAGRKNKSAVGHRSDPIGSQTTGKKQHWMQILKCKVSFCWCQKPCIQSNSGILPHIHLSFVRSYSQFDRCQHGQVVWHPLIIRNHYLKG